jgi:DNA-binding FadR family transcriptional regulator
MLEFRLSIETEAAAMAAARITSEEVDRLRTIVKISASAPLADRADADFRFHHALARVSGNRYIAQVLDGLRVQAIPRNRIDPGAPSEKDRSGYEAKIAQEHELIVDALAIGDSSAARAAMHLHLAHSRDRLIAALERIPAESHRRKRRGERP